MNFLTCLSEFSIHIYLFLTLFIEYSNKESGHNFEDLCFCTEWYLIDSLIYFMTIFFDLKPDFIYYVFVILLKVYY